MTIDALNVRYTTFSGRHPTLRVAKSPKMADFEVYIDDDRYEAPSLYLISASSEGRARAIVDELWRSSEHHQGVELRLDGERLWGLGSLAEGAPASRPSGQCEASGSTG